MKLEYGFQGCSGWGLRKSRPLSQRPFSHCSYPALRPSCPEIQFFESTRCCHLRMHIVIHSPPPDLANSSFRCQIGQHFLWELFWTLPVPVRFASFVIYSIPHFCSKSLCHSRDDHSLKCLPNSFVSSLRARTMLSCPSLSPSKRCSRIITELMNKWTNVWIPPKTKEVILEGVYVVSFFYCL